MGKACCARRRNDRVIDQEEIARAVAGRHATLSPAELDVVVLTLARDRHWGLTLIARHTNYSRSHINAIMRRQGIVNSDPQR